MLIVWGNLYLVEIIYSYMTVEEIRLIIKILSFFWFEFGLKHFYVLQ